jgi:hypothetical protein
VAERLLGRHGDDPGEQHGHVSLWAPPDPLKVVDLVAHTTAKCVKEAKQSLLSSFYRFLNKKMSAAASQDNKEKVIPLFESRTAARSRAQQDDRQGTGSVTGKTLNPKPLPG